ncbi:MAG: hypothetical protein EB060_06655 [Proteobacteria bacterium]|nr:hypothetical protein [Pseudomonadota bacterium]
MADKQADTNKDASKANSKLMMNLVIMVIVVVVLISGLMAVGLSYIAVIVIMGLLPGIVAYILDRRKGKAASRTIMGFNLAGLLPQVISVLTSPSPNALAREMMSNPFTWFWVYLFACFGWVVIHLVPQIAYLFLSLKAEYTVKRMRSQQEKLIKEWGEEIKS